MPEVKQTNAFSIALNEPPPHLTPAQLRQLVVQLLCEVCCLREDVITDTARIDHELAMESVQIVQLQVALEQELDVTIDFLEVLRLNRFGPILEYLYELTTRRRAA